MVHFFKPLHFLGSLLILVCLSACNPTLEEGKPIVIESVSPAVGQLAGGDTITISGTGLGFVESIYFGSELCVNIEILSQTQVTCETPAHSAGSVAVTVNGKAKKTATVSSAFTYQVGPTVSAISPTDSSTTGGGTLVITGTGFISGATVSVGGVSCPVTSTTSTAIHCTIPSRSAGAKSVVVVNPDSQNVTFSSLNYVAPPTISTIFPAGGALTGGTTVTINGTGFTNSSTVKVDGVSCTTVNYVNAYKLECVTPVHAAGTVSVAVTNSTPVVQTTTLSNSFTYRLPPSISSLSVTAGTINGGTLTLLTGTGFESGSVVKIGSVACTGNGYVSSIYYQCTTPANAAGTYAVSVTNTDGQSVTGLAYTYRPAPTITSISPSVIPAGISTPITITGTGFVAGATVKIGTLSCISPPALTATVVSATSITCMTPINVAGSYIVKVTNTDNQYGVVSSGVTYQAAPIVTAITPNVGSTAGGTVISVTGTGFLTGATVFIGSIGCTGVGFTSNTTLTCTTVAQTHGAYSVTVTNTDAQSGAKPSAFTYQIPATLQWDISGTHPANPDNYGTTTTNVTHTYYLKNTGDVSTSVISTVLSGANAASWSVGTDNCNNSTLAAGASCTVDVTFLGLTNLAGTYTANIDATASSGGSVSNVMNATRGP